MHLCNTSLNMQKILINDTPNPSVWDQVILISLINQKVIGEWHKASWKSYTIGL